MAQVCKFGLMEQSMMENGLIIWQMVEVNFGMQMEIFTMVNGSMIKQMGMVLIYIKMERGMMATGRMTCKMEKELKYGQTVPSMKVSIRKE
jgi:hypothetical protein